MTKETMAFLPNGLLMTLDKKMRTQLQESLQDGREIEFKFEEITSTELPIVERRQDYEIMEVRIAMKYRRRK